MGADLFLTWLQIDKRKQPNFEAGREAIGRLAATKIEDWPADYLQNILGDVLQGCTPESEASTLSDDLGCVIDGWDGLRRDCCVMTICHRRILITGGMSWGDTPSDAYDSIGRLMNAGVSKACGFIF